MAIHREVLKVHDAVSSDSQPLGVENPAVGKQSDGYIWNLDKTKQFALSPDKSVGSGDCVQVALLPIVHKGVRFPDFSQHFYRQGQSVLKYFCYEFHYIWKRKYAG